jgi:hypothetical protein
VEPDLSSELIRVRPARCGQVGQNAGTIVALGRRDDLASWDCLSWRAGDLRFL